VDLSGANLTGANLNGADLRNANLYGANLSGATFSTKTDLTDADLTNTNRRGCRGFDKAIKVGAEGLDGKQRGSIHKGNAGVGKAGSRSINFHDRRGEEDFGRSY
jgi:hypothetical protein